MGRALYWLLIGWWWWPSFGWIFWLLARKGRKAGKTTTVTYRSNTIREPTPEARALTREKAALVAAQRRAVESDTAWQDYRRRQEEAAKRMVRCRYCGKSSPAGSARCGYCGAG